MLTVCCLVRKVLPVPAAPKTNMIGPLLEAKTRCSTSALVSSESSMFRYDEPPFSSLANKLATASAELTNSCRSYLLTAPRRAKQQIALDSPPPRRGRGTNRGTPRPSELKAQRGVLVNKVELCSFSGWVQAKPKPTRDQNNPRGTLQVP